MLCKVFKENDVIRTGIHRSFALGARRISHVRVNSRKVPKVIKLRYQAAIRVQENQLEGELPVGKQTSGQRVAGSLILLQIINQDESAHELLVQSINHTAMGEQTCSQVGAAGSATLVVKRPPQEDGENRPLFAL